MNLENQLTEAIKDENIKNISAELLEIGIDEILDNEFLKSMPIVSTIRGFTKFGLNYKDRLFTKKIITFLFQLKDVPKNERQEFIFKLDSNSEYKSKVGEKLITIIDRADELIKVKIIGNLFKSAIQGKISIEDFNLLCSLLNNTFIGDLMSLKKIEFNTNSEPDSFEEILSEDVKSRLYRCSILKREIIINLKNNFKEFNFTLNGRRTDRNNLKNGLSRNVGVEKFEYEISKEGRLILKYGFSNQAT